MLTVILCDDNAREREYLKSLVLGWASESGTKLTVHEFSSAEELLFSYSDCPPDILLLDIELSGMNGVELAKTLRARSDFSQIIFITGYPDFIADGYDVSALHYLLKPVRPEKLFEVLTRAAENVSRLQRAVVLKTADGIERLPVETIIYAEAFSHLVSFVCAGRSCEVRCTISEAKAMLGEGFIQCHRSYIVALKYIKTVGSRDILLDNGVRLPVSRQLYKEVKTAYLSYYGVI